MFPTVLHTFFINWRFAHGLEPFFIWKIQQWSSSAENELFFLSLKYIIGTYRNERLKTWGRRRPPRKQNNTNENYWDWEKRRRSHHTFKSNNGPKFYLSAILPVQQFVSYSHKFRSKTIGLVNSRWLGLRTPCSLHYCCPSNMPRERKSEQRLVTILFRSGLSNLTTIPDWWYRKKNFYHWSNGWPW